ncbi:hypothetical protein VB712_18395 [Spirulina sp. CCNP1310]|uniref:hypothetical protein n=1 Tax=Spirulina sp. CCNP1310 TaxID=3110249 RepID=UPI002B2063E0|nr:hypothetical protein [Spirulina sp. CCNP1310]MEA5421198.1 hypothetical protein [Spirulina sp. CCNP1310]
MTSVDPTPYEDDEISLVDIFRFLLRNGRFILATTIIFTVGGLLLNVSRQTTAPGYSQTLTLTITPTPLRLPSWLQHPSSTNLIANSPLQSISINQIYVDAVAFLNENPPTDFQAQATHDTTNQRLDITLTAPDRDRLLNADEAVITTINTLLAERTAAALPTTLANLDRQIEQFRTVLTRLETEIATETNPLRQAALETERARLVTQLIAQEQDYADLNNLEGEALLTLSQEIFPILILDPSEITESIGGGRSPLQIAILSMIAGFMVATLAAIIREQIPHWRAELAAATQPQKPSE